MRSAAAGDEAGGHGSDHHHRRRTRSKLQIHRHGAYDIAEEYKHRRNEKTNLQGIPKRDADAHVEMVLSRGRECHGHLCRRADQRDDDEPDEGRTRPQCLCRRLQ